MLDGSIVTVTVFEMLVSVLATSAGMNLSFLRMLRMLRLLRVLRLMKSWTGLYRIVVTFIKALPQVCMKQVQSGAFCIRSATGLMPPACVL